MPDIFNTLKDIYNQNKNSYIRYIRFPYYKKIKENERIDFNYPITAIIGTNGASKSSILRAIYSTPEGKSIGEYWFESHIDKVKDEDRQNIPKSAFIYGYFNETANQVVEVLTKRAKRENNPDYWERTAPQMQYNMEKPPSGRGRWEPFKKSVSYLDFRHEAISAFDKYFYGKQKFNTPDTIASKKKFVRKKTGYLNKIISENMSAYPFRNIPRLFENTLLSDDQIGEISKILGKKYSRIRFITHSFYTKTPETTIYLSTEEINYSEAFAGSGEFSVVSLVKAVMEADPKSLIILDEPECSLHPGAQTNLLQFLAKQSITNGHQFVMATHSPVLIKKLPSEAIKLIIANPDGTNSILQNIHPDQAFNEIGWETDKTTIIVEDKSAQSLIETIINKNNLSKVFNVQVFPGGAENIIKHSILNNAILDNKNIFYLLDGDKRKEHKRLEDVSDSELENTVEYQTGLTIKKLNIPCSGNSGVSNPAEKTKILKELIKYYYSNVFYLAGKTPEKIIWESAPKNHTEDIPMTSSDGKEEFCKLAAREFAKTDSETISLTISWLVNKIDIANNKDCRIILQTINDYLS